MMAVADKPVVLVGAGGHAAVVADALRLSGSPIVAVISPSKNCHPAFSGIPLLASDDRITEIGSPGELMIAIGLGSVGDSSQRKVCYETYRDKGYEIVSVKHPSAIVASDVKTEHGAQLLAGALVQPGSKIGENTIVNSGAVVDHDCFIEAHVHVSPGAVICGNVRVGSCSHVGARAVILQGLEIGFGSVIGAGAVVTKPVDSGCTVVGVPARASYKSNGA